MTPEIFAGSFALGFIFVWLAILVCSLLMFAFWVWMLIDCATRPLQQNDKICWLLVVILTHWIGATIYFFVVRQSTPRPPRLR
jgi:hypothetical protein